MMTEASANTILNQYFREKQLYCYYELKQDGNKGRFSFANIRQVQWDGLQAMEKHGLIWKLSDEISRPKPCDGFSLPPLPAYLIIKFDDGFYFIRFKEIVKLKDEGVISITKVEAEKLAERIIKTKL